MGRTITLNDSANTFRQSEVGDNFELIIKAMGGNDVIVLNRTDDLGGGNRVSAGLGNDSVINSKEFGNIITLNDGDDTYVGTGFGSFSTDLIDQVFGGAGKDTFAVETFHSEYYGGDGNDVFHSVGWQNGFFGGRGNDTISFLPRVDDSTQGDTGVTIDLAAGFVQTGGSRRETISSIENATGSANGDFIFGSSVANRIAGGRGFDEMTGEGGADTFVYSHIGQAAINSDFADIITDFKRAQHDHIDLHSMDARTDATGNQAFRFITTGFTGHSGELRFAGGFVMGDVNGDGTQDFRILMLGVTSMQASDFVL